MPSTDTITGFTNFVAGQRIKSAEMNANFAIWRGHHLPMDPTATAADATSSYDLGSATYPWRKLYAGAITGKRIRSVAVTTGSMNITSSHDCVLFNPGATVTANLPALAGMTDGQILTLKNRGTGGFSVYVDGNGAETIDNTTTFNLIDGESADLMAYGGAWYSL